MNEKIKQIKINHELNLFVKNIKNHYLNTENSFLVADFYMNTNHIGTIHYDKIQKTMLLKFLNKDSEEEFEAAKKMYEDKYGLDKLNNNYLAYVALCKYNL